MTSKERILAALSREKVDGAMTVRPVPLDEVGEEAWSAAADLSDKLHIIYKDKPFHTVLSRAPEMYDDIWTAGKCMYKLEPVVADGGTLIICAPHVTEVSYTHGKVIDQIGNGHFSRGDAGLFRPLVDNLLNHDPFLLLADYQSYVECQDRVSAAYLDKERWVRMSILNVARVGRFSSDRAVREYCQEIWKCGPQPIKLSDLTGSELMFRSLAATSGEEETSMPMLGLTA